MTTNRYDAIFRRLALAAGDAIMAIYESDDLGVRTKADDSPVTRADLAADKVIHDGLSAAFPDIQLVTEERAPTHGGARARQFFLVDPLDGTREFVKRGGDFTVNIALIEDGAPVAGVVYAPAKKRLFQTLDEGGAIEEMAGEAGGFAVDAPGVRRALRAARPDPGAIRVVASASHRDAETDAYIARYPVGAFKPAGSSLKFCLVAAGEADLYPRLGRTMEWDTAAGHAILRAAGGHVDVLETPGARLGYGKPGDDNPHFVAYAPGVEIL